MYRKHNITTIIALILMLLMVFAMAVKARAQTDQSAALWRSGWNSQVNRMLDTGTVIGKAIGCEIIPNHGIAWRHIVDWALELEREGMMRGAIGPDKSDPSHTDFYIERNVGKRMDEGIASVKIPGGCDFWKDHPDMVYQIQNMDRM
jgi:hypothetical protein